MTTNLNARPKILVVDDSRIVRATVRKHLAELYDLIEECDGEAGWKRLLADEDISMLLSDLTMPELDGLGLLARIRSSGDPRLHALPVIIISGEEDEATKNQCVSCGANDFVSKSADRTEMVARVKANLELAATRRELVESRNEQSRTATTDGVTGVGSQHLLKLQLEQSLAFALRHNSEVTLVLLEINHFLQLQDKLSERVAQQMLGLLAKMLQGKLRKEDTLAHLGGALFAVTSPGTTLTEARVLADRLRLTIANAKVNFRSEPIMVTASLAVANSWHDEASSVEHLHQVALDRLYANPQPNQIVLPESSADGLPTPLVAEALVMLHKGLHDELRPHLPALMQNLRPLLELACTEMGLSWSLDELNLR